MAPGGSRESAADLLRHQHLHDGEELPAGCQKERKIYTQANHIQNAQSIDNDKLPATTTQYFHTNNICMCVCIYIYIYTHNII